MAQNTATPDDFCACHSPSDKVMKPKFCQVCHGHGGILICSKPYSSKLVETCWQAEKRLKGLKRQKSFCGFADDWAFQEET